MLSVYSAGGFGIVFFFSSRRRHTILTCDWSSDVCSSDLSPSPVAPRATTWGVVARGATGEGDRGVEVIEEIGRASCRERGEIAGDVASVRKKRRVIVC